MVKALVLRTAGTNCEGETVHALKTCGAEADLLHIHQIFNAPQKLMQYSIMVIPGGFSYGDDIAAGKILANELKIKLGNKLREYIFAKKLLIGICNGFQVLVKAGLLPGLTSEDSIQTTTLAANDSGRFQCEWVSLKKEKSRAQWLNLMMNRFELPIAHGEGKFLTKNRKILTQIERNRQIVFRYFPKNPNGSIGSIAGICNASGNVIGMMPHPERYLTPYHNPAWSRNGIGNVTPGLQFWKCAVDYARNIA